jgi:hypothetical protein
MYFALRPVWPEPKFSPARTDVCTVAVNPIIRRAIPLSVLHSIDRSCRPCVRSGYNARLPHLRARRAMSAVCDCVEGRGPGAGSFCVSDRGMMVVAGHVSVGGNHVLPIQPARTSGPTPSTVLRQAPGRQRLNLRRGTPGEFLMPQERSRSRTSIYRAGQTRMNYPRDSPDAARVCSVQPTCT